MAEDRHDDDVDEVSAVTVGAAEGQAGGGQAHRSLRLLVEANQAILSELTLQAVLQRIVSFARELVDARYAALGVVGPDGGLEQFVHVGMAEAEAERVGQLPRGDGLLGALVQEPRPLRLDRIADDPRHVGFPAHHPPMEGFLGVPIRVRAQVYGTLYLTEKSGGRPFTAEDGRTIAALAVTAGIAVENARLFEDSRRRQQWAEAAAEISAVLLDPAGGTDPVGLVASTVRRLTGAEVVSVVVPTADGQGFRVQLARGRGAQTLEGMVYGAARSVAATALRTGRGVRLGPGPDREGFDVHLDRVLAVGPVLAVPLHGSVRSHGVLVVARPRGAPPFAEADLELSESFAAQAAIALELAQARADQQRLVVLEDRERIARDLHDHVIQRLFASGLTLEGLTHGLEPAAAARVGAVVEDLDVTIHQIRSLIFQLQSPEEPLAVRAAVLDAVASATQALGWAPTVAFDGPVDTLVPSGLVVDVGAVVREALSNVARHARAGRASVRVSVHAADAPGTVQVRVADDGTGPGSSRRRSGLANLERRALKRGGTFELAGAPSGGTELRWTVPLA